MDTHLDISDPTLQDLRQLLVSPRKVELEGAIRILQKPSVARAEDNVLDGFLCCIAQRGSETGSWRCNLRRAKHSTPFHDDVDVVAGSARATDGDTLLRGMGHATMVSEQGLGDVVEVRALWVVWFLSSVYYTAKGRLTY